MTFLGPLALLLFAATAAAAQDAAPKPPQDLLKVPLIDREMRARAGRDVRLLTVTNLRPDCTSGPLPTVRLIAAPANGRLAVRHGRWRATNVRQCLAAEVPALIALYRATPGFEGSDTVIFEIRPDQGSRQIRRITIKVTRIDDGINI